MSYRAAKAKKMSEIRKRNKRGLVGVDIYVSRIHKLIKTIHPSEERHMYLYENSTVEASSPITACTTEMNATLDEHCNYVNISNILYGEFDAMNRTCKLCYTSPSYLPVYVNITQANSSKTIIVKQSIDKGKTLKTSFLASL